WGREKKGSVPVFSVDWWGLVPWVVAALLAFLIATIPDWRLNETTIFGDNPDSHQVVGSAVLLQQAPPWQTRAGLPINRVPTSWRFRYPILYAIAGTANLSHYDPIYVFPALSALLVMLAALGFGVLAVLCLRLPARAGPWVAMTVPLNAFVLGITWHPYYNQLWGLALLPWTAALGWYAVRERSRSAGIGFAVMLVALALAYPLAVLYPLVLVAGMAWAHRLRRPRIPRPQTRGQWVLAVIVAALLLVPLAGAIYKVIDGLRQLFTPNGFIWAGDVFQFQSLSSFVGTNGGAIGMLAVLAIAAITAVRLLERREVIALGVLLGVCVLFDVRLRLSDRGQYMDLKHLGYVGAFVLAFAAAGVVALVLSRRRPAMAAALALFAVWLVPAIGRIRDVVGHTHEQVTADMLDLRDWAARLPRDASIRVDIPPNVGGVQLWAQYMLAGHPLGSVVPVLNTTYAHLPRTYGADYSLALRYVPSSKPGKPKPWPHIQFTTDPPVYENPSFVLRHLHTPYGKRGDFTSRLMVQP
ncbi:MAG TPA: hypothetical protein VM684_18765, partial [Gaiellales bacterium]|nr:hypothetical protein [Gaiellales bacterium]